MDFDLNDEQRQLKDSVERLLGDSYGDLNKRLGYMKEPKGYSAALWKQYADLINTAFDSVWLGAEPKSTLLGVQARAQQLIDAAAARKRQRRSATDARSPASTLA